MPGSPHLIPPRPSISSAPSHFPSTLCALSRPRSAVTPQASIRRQHNREMQSSLAAPCGRNQRCGPAIIFSPWRLSRSPFSLSPVTLSSSSSFTLSSSSFSCYASESPSLQIIDFSFSLLPGLASVFLPLLTPFNFLSVSFVSVTIFRLYSSFSYSYFYISSFFSFFLLNSLFFLLLF